jgi:hypothetical protein
LVILEESCWLQVIVERMSNRIAVKTVCRLMRPPRFAEVASCLLPLNGDARNLARLACVGHRLIKPKSLETATAF